MPTLREMLAPVVVIDDEPDDIEILRRRLIAAGIANPLIAFVNGSEALAFLRSLPESPEAQFLRPCVLFLDINMPQVHGFVFLKWVRSQSSLDDVRVVVLSGSDKPQDKERAMKLGADRYLVKFPAADVFAQVMSELGDGVLAVQKSI